MRKIVITFIVAISIMGLANAQDYKMGLGVRAGFSSGLTIKYFL